MALRRVVGGLVLPYGRVVRHRGRRVRFAPGSLRYTDPRQVRLLHDHDRAQRLGRLAHADASPDGMRGWHTVAPGPKGDRALARAADRTEDGFSVGVDVLDEVPDPDEQGVVLVLAAWWNETSLLAVPAFPEARVEVVIR